MTADDNTEDEPTLDDLRLLVREIKKFRQMGDTEIIQGARGALLRVLHCSTQRLRKT